MAVRLHEAGHAVVARVLGVPFERVTRDELVFAPGYDRDGTALAVVALAGSVAACLFASGVGSPNRRHSESDLHVAASALGVDTLGAYAEAQLERHARRILLDHETAVRAVAEALGRVRELDARQVGRLCAGHAVDAATAAA
jgi:hypothetical protein